MICLRNYINLFDEFKTNNTLKSLKHVQIQLQNKVNKWLSYLILKYENEIWGSSPTLGQVLSNLNFYLIQNDP